jgi:hypothetical protein
MACVGTLLVRVPVLSTRKFCTLIPDIRALITNIRTLYPEYEYPYSPKGTPGYSGCTVPALVVPRVHGHATCIVHHGRQRITARISVPLSRISVPSSPRGPADNAQRRGSNQRGARTITTRVQPATRGAHSPRPTLHAASVCLRPLRRRRAHRRSASPPPAVRTRKPGRP